MTYRDSKVFIALHWAAVIVMPVVLGWLVIGQFMYGFELVPTLALLIGGISLRHSVEIVRAREEKS